MIAVTAFAVQAEDAKNEKCPVSGKDVNPKCCAKYEGKTYAFCCGNCCKTFMDERKNSLYHKIGGKKALSAAVVLSSGQPQAPKRPHISDF